MADEALTAFAARLQDELRLAAEIEGPEASYVDLLTERMVSELTEAGELDDGYVCQFQARGIQVSGYSLPEEERGLALFTTLHVGSVPPQTVGRTETETALRRLSGFLTLSRIGQHVAIRPDTPEYAMLEAVHLAVRGEDGVRLFLFTDGLCTMDSKPDEVIDGVRVSYHIWDIRRLFRCVTSGQHREPITVDFRQFGGPLQCLEAPRTGTEYQTYLAAISGAALAAIYERFGPRLLELNVRAFLQARGKVNRDIRSTILTQPERFLAYNNGISVTTARVELGSMPEGGKAILSADDLQIVNGGQTTASLYLAAKRDRADLGHVLVPMKVSVVSPDHLREVVPLISRYANSQNKINNADFHANDPFHVRLEELSRTVWAPPAPGEQRQTHWFYERARGQYQDERSRGRPAEFRRTYPPTQRFTKTDLAIFEHCWDQLPHLVSAGAEKNFREFTLRLGNRQRQEPDQAYFQRFVAKAILYRGVRDIVTAERFGGYRANVVAYTVAILAHHTAQRVDLDRIWRHQVLGPRLHDVAQVVARAVHASITDPPGGANVTEWCKREACWARVRSLEFDLSKLADELVPVGKSTATTIDRGMETPDSDNLVEIERVTTVGPAQWFALANWARVTGNLQPWQRSLAFSIGRLLAQSRAPSWRQAHQGLRMLTEAHRLGFAPDGVEAATLVVADG